MTNEYFDKQATQWDDKPLRIKRSKTIADFISEKIPLSKELSVLDYGCGTGLVSFFLSDKAASVCAADISDGMLAEVQKKITAQNIRNIETVNFDVTKNMTLNKTFDVIVSAMAMHHIEEPFDAITKLTKLLNPGGWIALADLCAEDGSFHEKGVAMHNGFEPAEIAEHLKNLKMTSVICKNIFEIFKNEKNYPVFCVCARKI